MTMIAFLRNLPVPGVKQIEAGPIALCDPSQFSTPKTRKRTIIEFTEASGNIQSTQWIETEPLVVQLNGNLHY